MCSRIFILCLQKRFLLSICYLIIDIFIKIGADDSVAVRVYLATGNANVKCLINRYHPLRKCPADHDADFDKQLMGVKLLLIWSTWPD